MKGYVITLGVYIALLIAMKLYEVYEDRKNHYQKAEDEEAPLQEIPVAKIYEAISIEERPIDMTDYPLELWYAEVEHEMFIEYLRDTLSEEGVFMMNELRN